jgi:hypothetical protein
MRLLIALTVTAAALAAAALAGGGTASASCIASVRLNGITYIGTGFPHLPRRGAAIKGGVQPGCNDTGPSTRPEPDLPAQIAALAGVPARIAVAGPAGSVTVYLAPGFLVGLRSHPLYAYAAKQTPSALFGCRRSVAIRGRVSDQGFAAQFTLRAGGRDVTVRVRPSTTMSVPRLAGMPYLANGWRLEVRGCRAKSGRVIAAYSIRRLAPMP